MLRGLTDQQRQVVEATSGHIAVLAGPGSGKTHTLTTKVGYLFDTEVVPSPYRVAALTFTNAAAREMRKRLRAVGFSAWDRLFMGTYHAFGQHLLRAFGRHVGISEDFDLDPVGAQKILANVAVDFPRVDAGTVRRRIERCKRHGTRPDEIEPQDDEEDDFLSLYRAYDHELRKAGVLDYADLILWAERLLAEREDIRERVTNTFRYVVADEFQDTDRQQLELVIALAERSSSTVVADDDQSIFGWRGAVRANVQSARERLQATPLTLGVNFRSDTVIVEAAQHIIAGDPSHRDKGLVAASEEPGAICVDVFDTVGDEAVLLADRISELLARSAAMDASEVAVISRARWRVESLLSVLSARSLSWFERERLRFEDSWESQLGLATLSFLSTVDPAESLHILVTAVEDSGADWAFRQDALSLATTIRRRVDERTNGSDASLMAVLKRVDLPGWIQRLAASESDADRRLANLSTMVEELVADASDTGDVGASICRFLGRDSIQVMTGHASKGREFDVVFLVGLEDDTLPTYHSHGDAEELAEERRIFYVGLTRARRLAHISRVTRHQNRYGKWFQKDESRFLRAIPAEMRSTWSEC